MVRYKLDLSWPNDRDRPPHASLGVSRFVRAIRSEKNHTSRFVKLIWITAACLCMWCTWLPVRIVLPEFSRHNWAPTHNGLRSRNIIWLCCMLSSMCTVGSYYRNVTTQNNAHEHTFQNLCSSGKQVRVVWQMRCHSLPQTGGQYFRVHSTP